MTGERNYKIVQRFLNEGDLSAMKEDAEFYDYTRVEPVTGSQAISDYIYSHYNIWFQDAVADFSNIVKGEKSVVLEFTFRGIHQGEMRGIPPTGKVVELPMCVIYDVENDIITQGRLYFDAASMLKQLGVDSLDKW